MNFGWIQGAPFNGNATSLVPWYPGPGGIQEGTTGPNTRRHGDSHRACGGRAGSGRETGRKLRSRLAGSAG